MLAVSCSRRFKGSADAVQLVQLTTDALLNRRFPSDTPKGKGNRISVSSGVLMTCNVQLPSIANVYRQRWMAKRQSFSHGSIVSSNGPPALGAGNSVAGLQQP